MKIFGQSYSKHSKRKIETEVALSNSFHKTIFTEILKPNDDTMKKNHKLVSPRNIAKKFYKITVNNINAYIKRLSTVKTLAFSLKCTNDSYMQVN